uniref:Putative secreted protein n=1 Tax=Anopheles triannulatus TaxID=58253 RepID=A0A2M4B7M9_9DIPT
MLLWQCLVLSWKAIGMVQGQTMVIPQYPLASTQSSYRRTLLDDGRRKSISRIYSSILRTNERALYVLVGLKEEAIIE